MINNILVKITNIIFAAEIFYWMDQLYRKSHHYVAVDCVIFGYQDDDLKLLAYPRAFAPYEGDWSLMGGFLSDDEDLDEAAARVLRLRAGLDDIFLKEVGCFSSKDRDPAGRVVSVVYYALVDVAKQDASILNHHGARWFSIKDLPEMILDHKEMVHQALDQLRIDANQRLLGKELMPQYFTLLQLRNVYQAIFDRELELANFRKKILSLNILEKQDFKNTTESRKGAYYFAFRPEAENRLLDRIVKLY